MYDISFAAQYVREMFLTSMASIDVHVDTNGRELLEGVVDAGLRASGQRLKRHPNKCPTHEVRRLGVRALLDVQVGDQVGERVGLNDRNNADLRELCKAKRQKSERHEYVA